MHWSPWVTPAQGPPGPQSHRDPGATLALEPQATLAQGPQGHPRTGTLGPCLHWSPRSPLHKDTRATLALGPQATPAQGPRGHARTGATAALTLGANPVTVSTRTTLCSQPPSRHPPSDCQTLLTSCLLSVSTKWCRRHLGLKAAEHNARSLAVLAAPSFSLCPHTRPTARPAHSASQRLPKPHSSSTLSPPTPVSCPAHHSGPRALRLPHSPSVHSPDHS